VFLFTALSHALTAGYSCSPEWSQFFFPSPQLLYTADVAIGATFRFNKYFKKPRYGYEMWLCPKLDSLTLFGIHVSSHEHSFSKTRW
jgi:hypothetical protein